MTNKQDERKQRALDFLDSLLTSKLRHDLVLAERESLRQTMEYVASITLQVSEPEGWKLVPIEPTEEMLLGGLYRLPIEHCNKVAGIWEEMIAAAPAPPNSKGE